MNMEVYSQAAVKQLVAEQVAAVAQEVNALQAMMHAAQLLALDRINQEYCVLINDVYRRHHGQPSPAPVQFDPVPFGVCMRPPGD